MKSLLLTVFVTVFFSCILGKAQVTRSATSITQPSIPLTVPANISQLEVSGRLITQNSFLGLGVPPLGQQTGEFGINARWNSMGNLNISGASQVLNGFRTQTDGRGLAWGHSIPNGGTVSNPFIEWIGNNGVGVAPGNLDFRIGVNPTNFTPATVFTMAPNNSGTWADAYVRGNFLANTDGACLGHLSNGQFRGISGTDNWTAIGQVNKLANFTLLNAYGTNIKYKSQNIATGIVDATNAAGNPSIDARIVWGNDNSGFMKFQYVDNTIGIANTMTLNSSGQVYIGGNDFSTINPLSSPTLYAEAYAGVGNLFSGTAIYGKASFGRFERIGVFGDGSAGNGSGSTKAIYGIAPSGDYAGFFNGDVFRSGTDNFTSDKRLKKDIQPMTSMLDIVMQLKPSSYEYNNEASKTLILPKGKQVGFIAQELAEVLPELVKDFQEPFSNKEKFEEVRTFKSINYIALIPILTKAIQEQQTQIEALKNQLQSFKANEITVINETTEAATEKIKANSFMMAQNVPNPFNSNTTIKYSIPANNTAMIAVFDLNGKMLLQFLNLKGAAQVTINGNTLQAGMYLYSLLVNGQEIITKKMILTR